ncbi:MAG: hypothetical protein HY704_10390 [Gemmatimonadetes bacterium]|nr:hypothetical protein [Gemmatimonadota bacterium]
MTRSCPRLVIPVVAALLVEAAVSPAAAAAQNPVQGSRYLALNGWAYEAIENLRIRGFLSNLDPLAQPYRRLDVARGLQRLDSDTLFQPLAHWVALLRQELRPELDRLAGRDSALWGLQALAGVTGSTSRRLDPLLPLREDEPGRLANRTWAYYGEGVWAEADRFAIETRLFHDLYQEAGNLGDPDGTDPGGITVLNRTDNAYVATAFSLGTLFLGRMRRNWAPLGGQGLMISDVATPYPHIGFEIGSGRLTGRFLAGELEPLQEQKRYIVAHYLVYRTQNLAASIGEAKVYAMSQGGPGLRYLNPFELLYFDHDAKPQDFIGNLVLDAQLWYRRDGSVFFGEFLLDDIDTAPMGRDPEPLTYAFAVGARFTSLAPWVELGVEYKQVSAFAYRTPSAVDVWSYLDRGLGDNFSDYDRLTLGASLFPSVPGLRITPTFQLQRKGEGNFRNPVPAEPIHLASPAIFLGVKETTVRLGLRGRYQPVRHAFLEWDTGENFVRNADHKEGESLTEFSGVARLGVALELPRGRLR